MHQRFQTVSDSATDYNPPLEAATATERAHLIHEAFKQLSLSERQLLEIAYYEGLSQSAIAQREGIPLGTVKSRSRLALKNRIK